MHAPHRIASGGIKAYWADGSAAHCDAPGFLVEPAMTRVHFTEADILHTGDTCWNGIYPFIDYSTGGSIDGSIGAANANLAVATYSTVSREAGVMRP